MLLLLLLLLLVVVLVVVSLSRLSCLLSLLLLLIMLEVAVQALQQEAGILTTVFLQYEIVFLCFGKIYFIMGYGTLNLLALIIN